MNPDSYPWLRQFFGGFFHQDWALEGDSWEILVSNFIRSADRLALLQTYDEFNRLLGESADDQELDEFIGHLGSCYRPTGISSREWVRALQKEILHGVPVK
jgi:hypothetical protein